MSGIEDSGWRSNLIEGWEGVRQVLAATKRVAVLGIRSEQHRSRPAFYVPQYLASAGLQVIPVPVYDMHVDEILGQKVFRRLVDIPGELDLWLTCSAAQRTSPPISMTCLPKGRESSGFSRE
jgi:hypothetical protein